MWIIGLIGFIFLIIKEWAGRLRADDYSTQYARIEENHRYRLACLNDEIKKRKDELSKYDTAERERLVEEEQTRKNEILAHKKMEMEELNRKYHVKKKY